jgi:hypothetical protein
MKKSAIIILVLSAMVLGLFGFLGVGMYSFYRTWHRSPIHLQDVDQSSDEAKAVVNNCGIGNSPVDHIYIYRERTLRGSTYIRFHYVNPADFEKRRQNEIAQRRHAEKNRPKDGSFPRDPDEAYKAMPDMQSWWVQKDQPDCEEYCQNIQEYVVLDKANNVIYIYFSGD